MQGFEDGHGVDTTVWFLFFLFQSWEVVTCQTMRWLCSAFVGADCWLAVGSDKPSNSPPSSPEEEDDESSEQLCSWFTTGVETVLHQFRAVLKQNGNQRKHGFLTHSEVNVAFASTHDQVCFGLGGCCVRGLRCKIIRAWISTWRWHCLTCDKRNQMTKSKK